MTKTEQEVSTELNVNVDFTQVLLPFEVMTKEGAIESGVPVAAGITYNVKFHAEDEELNVPHVLTVLCLRVLQLEQFIQEKHKEELIERQEKVDVKSQELLKEKLQLVQKALAQEATSDNPPES